MREAVVMGGDDSSGSAKGPEGSTASLAAAARDGDRPAFERLAAMYQEGIYRMAYARLQNVADAQDVVQDVFLSAYRSIARLKDPAMFRAWLYRIALNRTRDLARRRRLMRLFGAGDEQPEDHPCTGPDGFDRLASQAFWERFDAFLGTLPELQREVFRLRFLDGLAIHEIFSVMGKNESTVKTHLYRALEKFRACGDLAEGLEGGRGREGL